MTKREIVYRLRRNTAVRVLVWPVEKLRRRSLQRRYLKSEDSAFIKSLHNKHLGQRCFIIGNGPSLLPEDLDKLTGEITFATNRIYYIYPKTDWRPTYYISVDTDNLMAEIDRIKSSGSYTKFINFKGASYGRTPEDNLWYLNPTGKFSIYKHKFEISVLSEDVSHHGGQFSTVTANAIELAIYMGFKEIYLLGVDNNYAKTIDKNGKIHEDTSVKSSYFAGMQNGDGTSGDGIAVHAVDNMTASYVACKIFADNSGIRIYNATRGGKLEVFERVDFDELMKQPPMKL